MSDAPRPIRLHVVTNHADHAAIDIFAADPACGPAWARIITSHTDFASIPDGAKVITRFYGARGMFEDLWVEERVARASSGRGFNLDLFAHMDAIDAWRRRMWADADEAQTQAAAPQETAPQETAHHQQAEPQQAGRSRRIWS